MNGHGRIEVIEPREQHFLKDGRISSLLNSLKLEAIEPTGGDEIIATYCAASMQLIREGILAKVIQEALEFRDELGKKDISPRDLVQLMLRAFQKQLIRTDDNYADLTYETPEKWRIKILEILDDEDTKFEFEYDLTRDLQSNVPDRYKAHKLIMLSEKERLGASPTFLDVGTSDLLGPKKLKGAGGSFSRATVMKGIPGWNGRNLDRLQAKPQATHYINQRLKEPFTIGYSVGVDPMPRADQLIGYGADTLPTGRGDQFNSQWIFACSFRPKELRDKVKKQEFINLHNAHVSGIDFYEGYFNQKDMRALPTHTKVERYDVITFTTVMYMQPEEQLAMRALARELLKPDGLIIYQDFARVDPKNPEQLEFFDRWDPYTYRTIIEDPHETWTQLHEVFRWEGGRCTQLQLGKAARKLTMVKESELLSPLAA